MDDDDECDEVYQEDPLRLVKSLLGKVDVYFPTPIPTAEQVQTALENLPRLPVGLASFALLQEVSDAEALHCASVLEVCMEDAFPGSADLLCFGGTNEVANLRTRDLVLAVLSQSVHAVWSRARRARPCRALGEKLGVCEAGANQFSIRVNNAANTLTSAEDLSIQFDGTEMFLIESATGKDTLKRVMQTLVNKHAPNGLLLGDAPFLPALAIQYPHVQFCLAIPDASCAFSTFVSKRVGRQLDLRKTLDRVHVLTSALVFYELARKIVLLWPKDRMGYGISLGDKNVSIHRSGSSGEAPVKVENGISPRPRICVRKRLSREELRHIQWGNLCELYSLAEKIPFLVRAHALAAPDRGACEHVIQTYPVGHARFPVTYKELVQMATCVLQALSKMHELGFAHRDVRPPNVVRLSDGNWWLIDLERALKCDGKTLATPWPKHFNRRYLPKLHSLEEIEFDAPQMSSSNSSSSSSSNSSGGEEKEEDDTVRTSIKSWLLVYDVWQLARAIGEITFSWSMDESMDYIVNKSVREARARRHQMFGGEPAKALSSQQHPMVIARNKGKRLAEAIWRACWMEGELPATLDMNMGPIKDDGKAAQRALRAIDCLVV